MTQHRNPTQSTLSGVRVLSIISPEEFNDDEFLKPKAILEGAGALVRVASIRLGQARGMFGHVVSPEMELAEVKLEEFDAVTIAGGSGTPRHLWRNPTLQEMVRKVFQAGKMVAAICLAPAILAEAGLLRGVPATVYPSPKAIALLKEGGAFYQDSETVRAGRILTGRDPQAAETYGKSLVQAIQEEVLKKEGTAS